MLESHLVQSHLELFGKQHRHRRVHALSHFDLGHDHRDAAIRADADERIGRERGRRRRAGSGCRARPLTDPAAEQEPGPAGGEHHHKVASRYGIHRQAPFPATADPRAACLMAARMRPYVPQRQILPDIAASISASLGFAFFATSADADMIWPDWQ